MRSARMSGGGANPALPATAISSSRSSSTVGDHRGPARRRRRPSPRCRPRRRRSCRAAGRPGRPTGPSGERFGPTLPCAALRHHVGAGKLRELHAVERARGRLRLARQEVLLHDLARRARREGVARRRQVGAGDRLGDGRGSVDGSVSRRPSSPPSTPAPGDDVEASRARPSCGRPPARCPRGRRRRWSPAPRARSPRPPPGR